MSRSPLAEYRSRFGEIPHQRALGLSLESLSPERVVGRIPYRAELVGDPLRGIVHGGVVTTLLDAVGGAAVLARLGRLVVMATLDLRIDYLRPSTPGEDLWGEVTCYKVTRNVAFARGIARNGDADDPVASMAATYMLNTPARRHGNETPAGKPDARSPSSREGGGRAPDGGEEAAPNPVPVPAAPASPACTPRRATAKGASPPAPSETLEELIVRYRTHEQFERIPEAIPYARFLGISVELRGGELTTRMRYHPMLIGNPVLPALHGGTLGALLEHAAIFRLLLDPDVRPLPKTINLTVEYLRSARPRDTFARAVITKHGRRVANVHVLAWQDLPERPMAAAHAHFLLRGPAGEEQATPPGA